MKDRWTQLLLALAVIVSSLIVIQTKHENRALVTELEQLRKEKQRLEVEWAQLQLEEATLAGHSRVEQQAREKLGLSEPAQYVIVEDSPP